MKISDNRYLYRVETNNADGSSVDFQEIETVEPLYSVGDTHDELDLENNKQIKRVEKIKFDGTSKEYWYVDEVRSTDDYVVAYMEDINLMCSKDNHFCETDRTLFELSELGTVGNYFCSSVEPNGMNRIYMSIAKEQLAYQSYTNETLKEYFKENPVTVWYVLRYPVEVPRSLSKGYLITHKDKTTINVQTQTMGKVAPVVKAKIEDMNVEMDSIPTQDIKGTIEGKQLTELTLEGVTLVNNAKGDNAKGTKELSHTRYGFEPFYDGSTTINNTVEGGYVSAKLYGDTMVNIVKPYGETPLLRTTESITKVSDLLGENEDGVELLDGEITEGRIYGDSSVGSAIIFEKGGINETTGAIKNEKDDYHTNKLAVPKKPFTLITNYTWTKIIYYDSNNRRIKYDWDSGNARPITSSPPTNASYVRYALYSPNGYPRTETITFKYEDGADVYVDINSVKNPNITFANLSKNLLNKNACTNNVINTNTGEVPNGAHSYWTSDFIPVSSTHTYEWIPNRSDASEICLYDKNKKFIKGLTTRDKTFTPSQDGYMRFVFPSSMKDTLQFGVVGTLNQDNYVPFETVSHSSITFTKTLNKLPNGVADYIDVVNKVHVQRVGRVRLDGNINDTITKWIDDSWNFANDFAEIECNVANLKGYSDNKTISTLSNTIPSITWNDAYKGGASGVARNEGITAFTNGRFVILLSTNKIPKSSTLEEKLAYLQLNPITVLYELATPICTPLTEEEIAQLPLTVYEDRYVTLSSEQLTPSFEFRMQSSNRYQVDMLETGYYYLNAPTGGIELGTTKVDAQQMPCIVKVDNVGTGDSGYRLKTSENFYKDILLNHEKGYLGIGNGVVQSDNSGRWASDFVELPINDTSLYVSEGTLIDVAFYNESQVFVSGKAVGNVHSISKFNVPANAKYIRVSGKNEEMKVFICKQPITLAKLPSHRIPSSFTQGMKHKIDFGYWKGIKESKPSNLYVSDEEHILIKDVKLNRIEYGSIVVEDEYDVATGKSTKRVGQTLIDERHVNHFLVWNGNKGDYCAFFIYLDKTSVGVNNGKASGIVLNNILPSNVGGYLGTTNGINRIHSSGYIPFSLHKNILGVSDVNNTNEVKEAVKVFIKNHPVTLFYELAVPEITYFEQSKYVVRTKANSTNLQCWKNTGYLVPRVEPSYLSYPTALTPNTTYTVFHNRKNYSGSVKTPIINLGGNESPAQGDKTLITTPAVLSHSELQFIGGENTVEQVMVLHGDWTKKGKTVDYFEGLQSSVVGDKTLENLVDKPSLISSESGLSNVVINEVKEKYDNKPKFKEIDEIKKVSLKGSTKYRDKDTGDILEVFESGKNLELIPVRQPVLTSINADSTKSNTITVDGDYRGIGEKFDTINLITGEVTRNIIEFHISGEEGYSWTGITTNTKTVKTTLSYQTLGLDGKVKKGESMLCDKLAWDSSSDDIVHVKSEGDGGESSVRLALFLDKTKFSPYTSQGINDYLKSTGGLTIQACLVTPTVETVKLKAEYVKVDEQLQTGKPLFFDNGTIQVGSATIPCVIKDDVVLPTTNRYLMRNIDTVKYTILTSKPFIFNGQNYGASSTGMTITDVFKVNDNYVYSDDDMITVIQEDGKYYTNDMLTQFKGTKTFTKPFIKTTNNTTSTTMTLLEPVELGGIPNTTYKDVLDVSNCEISKKVCTIVVDDDLLDNSGLAWNVATSTNMIELHTVNWLNNGYKKGGHGSNGLTSLSTFKYSTGGEVERVCVTGNLYVRIYKHNVNNVLTVEACKDYLRKFTPFSITYVMENPEITKVAPMKPYVSTRPQSGNIEAHDIGLQAQYLNYDNEQSIISPRMLGDDDSIYWEQGSQCYVYANNKEYIPLPDYNTPFGVNLDANEETQYVESLEGADIELEVALKEKGVYERTYVEHEDTIVYPDLVNLDTNRGVEVDYICGYTWQNPNDLKEFQHLGKLREDGQYEIMIGHTADDEIRLFEGDTHIELNYEGLTPRFELTYFTKDGTEVGGYDETSYTLMNCKKDSKLATGMVYGGDSLNLVSTVTTQNHNYSDFGFIKTLDNSKPYFIWFESSFDISELGLLNGGAWNVRYVPTTRKGAVKVVPTNASITGLRIRCDKNTNGGYKPIINAMVFEYQEGMENWEDTRFSTFVTGLTVSNTDRTQTIQYKLPTPLMLNKRGNIADVYDLITNTKCELQKTMLNGSLNWQNYGNANHIPNHIRMELGGGNGIAHPTGRVFVLTSPSALTFCADIWNDKKYAINNKVTVGMDTNGDYRCQILIPKLFIGEQQSLALAKQYLNNNPVEVWYETKTSKTMKQTPIPTTQSPQAPTFILPQQLRSVPNGVCDRLYWDENKGHYCIEKRIEVVTTDLNKFSSLPDYTGWEYQFRYTDFKVGKGWNTSNVSLTYKTIGDNKLSGFLNVGGQYMWFKFDKTVFPTREDVKQYLQDNPTTFYYVLETSEIIDLTHLNRKVELPSHSDGLTGYRVVCDKTNPQFGLTVPYKQLNSPTQPKNLNFKMDIADYILTWDDVKEARQYNIILNDRVISTTLEPQWNSGEEMYGYVLVEAQNEIADSVSEELYIKTVPNAPAQLTVAHNPNTDYYDFEISFVKTSAIADYYTVRYCVDNGEWIEKQVQAPSIDDNTKVLWRFSVYEIKHSIQVQATATNEIGTNDILPVATYYMSPTPKWTYRINSKEVFLRWMDESPYDTQYKLRYSYKSNGVFQYAYFEGDKQEIGKLYEAVVPLAEDDEVTLALCIVSEKENLYCKPVKASKELDPNLVPPKNFNFHWVARGLIEFYWEDNYDCDISYEYILEHRKNGEISWITDQQEIVAKDVAGKGEIYRLQYQMEDLEEVRLKVRMKWSMNESEWTEQLTTVFVPVDGNPPKYIRRTQTKDGLLVEWEAQQFIDSYHLYVIDRATGETLQHLQTQDNSVIVDVNYANPIEIEIYEVSRFTGGIEADKSDSMVFTPTQYTTNPRIDIYQPCVEKYLLETSTIQKASKKAYVINDINCTPNVKAGNDVQVGISTPFQISYHPLGVNIHQDGSKAIADVGLQVSTPDVKTQESVNVMTFERITDKYDMNFNVHTPSVTSYPITLEVNRVRIVCLGDSLTSGFNKGRLAK